MNTFNKNIVIVAPGNLPIPVPGFNGWGGIENTLTWICERFDAINQKYVLINDRQNYKKKVDDICSEIDSIVHLHDDEFAPFLNINKNYKLIATSHAPYHPFTELWNPTVYNHYYRLFNNIDAYFGQGEISNKNALQVNKNLKTGLCRCGIPNYLFEPYRKEKGNKKSLVIGKIEPRKNQYFLQHYFSNHLEMDFVGHLQDDRFIPQNIGKTKYLGTWSRQDVIQKMSDYSSLILLSSFEGDVLVVKEALAAGCSLIISDKSALNIDENLPFIKIYTSEINTVDFVNEVNRLNEENEKYRPEIINYFKKKFDISVTVDQYLDYLKKLYV
jgi:glycosyltransferase involved in cell wall biosynthesis